MSVTSKRQEEKHGIVMELGARKKKRINRTGYFRFDGYISYNKMQRWVKSIDWKNRKNSSHIYFDGKFSSGWMDQFAGSSGYGWPG